MAKPSNPQLHVGEGLGGGRGQPEPPLPQNSGVGCEGESPARGLVQKGAVQKDLIQKCSIQECLIQECLIQKGSIRVPSFAYESIWQTPDFRKCKPPQAQDFMLCKPAETSCALCKSDVQNMLVGWSWLRAEPCCVLDIS